MCHQDNDIINEEKQLEVEKLRVEIKQIRDQRNRNWIVTISLIVGIIGTMISGINTMSSMTTQYNAQTFKVKMETTQLFLDKILPSITSSETTSKEAARYGAYVSAASLANDFPELKNAIRVVLLTNSDNGDTNAKEAMKLIKE